MFIKHSVQLILTAVFIATAVIPACAQKKGITKGVKAVLGKKPPLTETAPVVCPNVTHIPSSLTGAATVNPSRTVTATALERQVTQATVKNLQFPIISSLPARFSGLEFLTGLQALQAYRPGWKSELRLVGFQENELALLEQTFVETDRFMFETDPDGNWTRPLVTDWGYTRHFTALLAEKIKLKDSQVKDLFGKFSRLDDVFTRLNFQSFIAINKRAPKESAPGDEGFLARHAKYNIIKRQPKPNPEVDGYIYGQLPIQFQTPQASYGSKGRPPRRTSDEILAQIEQFIKENNRLPSMTSANEAERSLRNVFNKACQKAETLHDGTSQKLLAIKKQWVGKIRTPEEVLTQVEQFIRENNRFPSAHAENEAELSLRQAFNHALQKAETSSDDTSLQLLVLKEQWVNNRLAPRTPEEVLVQIEQFIKDNGRLPSDSSQDEVERSLRNAFDRVCKKAETGSDDTGRQLLAIKEQWVTIIKRTPQEVLEQTEQFIKVNGRFPSAHSEDETERSLRKSFDGACKKAEISNDDTGRQLLALKEQWVNKQVTPRTPEEVVAQIEQFIKENGRLPSSHSADKTERSLRQSFNNACYKAKTLNDAISLHLLEIKDKYITK